MQRSSLILAASVVLVVIVVAVRARRGPPGPPSDPCAGVSCPPAQPCDPATGRCRPAPPDPCAGVSCPPAQPCDPATGRCRPPPDPCAGVSCPPAQPCDPATGQCRPPPPADPCAGVTCPSGSLCDPLAGGACVPATAPKSVTVRNLWPMDVNAIATAKASPGVVGPVVVKAGASVTLRLPTPSASGRLGFYPVGSTHDPTDSNGWHTWWEYSIDPSGRIWSNLTYVDTISQQLAYRLIGGDCRPTDVAACDPPSGSLDLEAWCPPDLLWRNTITGETLCMSPRTYCGGTPPPNFVQVNPTDPARWCSAAGGGPGAAVMAQVRACCQAGKCSGDMCDPAKITPFDVWGCAGPLANDSPRCAAFNRGLYTPGSGRSFADATPAYLARGCTPDIQNTAFECNPANYYQVPPFNLYSQGVHGTSGCPQNYAFAYDDQGATESGSHNCLGTGAVITLYRGRAPPQEDP